MTQMTKREALRLVVTGTGVFSLVVGAIWSFVLLTARAEQSVVEVVPMLEHGEMTNIAYAALPSGGRVRLRPDDSRTPLTPGDSVVILDYGKGGTVKFGRTFWREWSLATALTSIGAVLVLSGLYALRPRPEVARIHATQPS